MTEFNSVVGVYYSDISERTEKFVSNVIFLSNEFDGYSDYDLQHDLSLLMLDFPGDTDIALYTKALQQRGASVPQNPRWVYDPCARFGKKLAYDL